MSVNWTEIDKLVQAHRIISPTASEADLLRQLRVWWSFKYNRPFKDPLLDTYSIDELVYEYLTWYYLDPEHDPLEKKRKEKQTQDDEDWARRQLEEHKKKKEEPKKEPPSEPPPPLPDISTKF